MLEFMGLMVVLSGLISFVFSYSHVLNSMLSLEAIGLGIFFFSLVMFSGLGSEVYYSLYLLIMMVCESVLGLSLMITMSLSLGSEEFSAYSGVW